MTEALWVLHHRKVQQIQWLHFLLVFFFPSFVKIANKLRFCSTIISSLYFTHRSPDDQSSCRSVLLDKYTLRCAVAAERVLQPLLWCTVWTVLCTVPLCLVFSVILARISLAICLLSLYFDLQCVWGCYLSLQTGSCFPLHANLLISFTYCIQHSWKWVLMRPLTLLPGIRRDINTAH